MSRKILSIYTVFIEIKYNPAGLESRISHVTSRENGCKRVQPVSYDNIEKMELYMRQERQNPTACTDVFSMYVTPIFGEQEKGRSPRHELPYPL